MLIFFNENIKTWLPWQFYFNPLFNKFCKFKVSQLLIKKIVNKKSWSLNISEAAEVNQTQVKFFTY